MLASIVNSKIIPVLLLIFFAGKAFSQSDSLLIQKGTASYYAKKFQGRRTSSGEIFYLDSMTAAHKNLPFGTWVRVMREGGEQSVFVKVNDRLPQNSRHVIDVSRKAAEVLGLIAPGYAQVRIEAIDLDELDRLITHFAEKENLGLRLRPYYRGIGAPRVDPDFRLKKINPRAPLNFLR